MVLKCLWPATYYSGRYRQKRIHFLGEQFRHWKIFPQRDFAAGGFPLAGACKAATTCRTTAEDQVPRNDLAAVVFCIAGSPLEGSLHPQPLAAFLPAYQHAWRFFFPIPSKKSCPPISMVFVTLQRCQPCTRTVGQRRSGCSLHS